MRILVTGASRGIGAAVCRRLIQDRSAAANGPLQLALCAARESSELAAMGEAARKAGAEALALTGDLADPDVPQRLVGETCASFGGLDALVLNAGIAPVSALAALPLAGWERVMNVHLRQHNTA